MEAQQNYFLHLRSDLHLARKTWHVLSGLVGLYVYSLFDLDKEKVAIAIAILGGLNLILEAARLKIEKINDIYIKLFSKILRKSEAKSISGFCYYAFGCALTLYFFEERIAILAILFLIFSDPLSSLFGILYGKDKIMKNKSLQGSSAGFITCYLLTLVYGVYCGINSDNLMIFGLIAALIGAVSELFSNVVDDNLTIPLISGIGLTFLNKLIPLF